MKKIVMMMAALLMLSTADANAQGFLKKLKQKAQQAVMGNHVEESEETSEEPQTVSDEPADLSKLAVAEGSDIVPKRKTSTITWDGTITPSSASTPEALMRELPQLPSAEKMARSTMEERDAYAMQIARVVARATTIIIHATWKRWRDTRRTMTMWNTRCSYQRMVCPLSSVVWLN